MNAPSRIAPAVALGEAGQRAPEPPGHRLLLVRGSKDGGRDVGEQHRHQHRHRDQQEECLHQRVVLVLDGLQQHVAERLGS